MSGSVPFGASAGGADAIAGYLAKAHQYRRNGSAKRALVVGAEVPSPFVDWDDRNTAVLFGDGCGAAVVRARS